MTGNDAADLTALLGEFGGLWEITRTRQGYLAKRRPLPAPPFIFTAETVPALRELLKHGYDTTKLADLLRQDFAAGWDIEHLDPGSVWVAVSRDGGHTVITARDLGCLRTSLRRVPAGPPA